MAQKVSTTLGDRGRLEPGVAEDGKQQEVGLPDSSMAKAGSGSVLSPRSEVPGCTGTSERTWGEHQEPEV
jgi:hypothetical protein